MRTGCRGVCHIGSSADADAIRQFLRGNKLQQTRNAEPRILFMKSARAAILR
jgi:hypothetical protein